MCDRTFIAYSDVVMQASRHASLQGAQAARFGVCDGIAANVIVGSDGSCWARVAGPGLSAHWQEADPDQVRQRLQQVQASGRAFEWVGPVRHFVQCGFCHEMAELVSPGEAPYCGKCGHRAGIPRPACDCEACTLQRLGIAPAPPYPLEPWAVLTVPDETNREQGDVFVTGATGRVLFRMLGHVPYAQRLAAAERIVATVNHCAGVETTTLEAGPDLADLLGSAGVNRDLLTACETAAERLRQFFPEEQGFPRQPGDLLDILDKAVAKAKEQL